MLFHVLSFLSPARITRLLITGLCGCMALIIFASSAHAVGVFVTFRNTYAYAEGPRQGARILLKSFQVYPVLQSRLDSKKRFWRQIEIPNLTLRVKSQGWVPHANIDLFQPGDLLKIYAKPPLRKQDVELLDIVPVEDIIFLDKTEQSRYLKTLQWRAVRYTVQKPRSFWVAEWAGAFRLDVTTAFIEETHRTMMAASIPKKERERLHSGLIERGDSTQKVLWALGKPINKTEGQMPVETVWHYTGLKLHITADDVSDIE